MTVRRPTKLPRWHEWSIYLTFGLLLVTGAAWLVPTIGCASRASSGRSITPPST